jgi:hypothetical protein
MLTGSRRAILTASAALLLLIVWGKVADDIYSLPGPDSALFLLEFMLVIFLMEASNVVLTCDSTSRLLKGNDELSSMARNRVMDWKRVQLIALGKLMVGSFGLSLGLLLLGSLVSVSVNQIAFSGVLALAAVVAIFVLLTYRREPEDQKKSVA